MLQHGSFQRVFQQKYLKYQCLFIDYHNFIIRVIPQNYEFGIFVGAHN